MNRDVAEKVFEKIKPYPHVWINGGQKFEKFDAPYDEEKMIDLLSKGFVRIEYMGNELYPKGIIDLDQIIRDSEQKKYKEDKLKILTNIYRELARLNDKRELAGFVEGLTEKKVEKKSLD